ncbi:MAG: class I SAM-dependent methyltransferase [Thermoproteus sp.]|nr:class I SAM-dependent methyltransferase [Thermoproteus sp.]
MKARLVELYDKLSAVYDELYGAEQAVKYLKALAFVRGDRVLDAGCGTGLGLPPLYGRYVLCLDLSVEMLKIAKSKDPDADFVAADAALAPLRPKSFSTALAITVFEDLDEASGLSAYADVVVAESLGRWLIRGPLMRQS